MNSPSEQKKLLDQPQIDLLKRYSFGVMLGAVWGLLSTQKTFGTLFTIPKVLPEVFANVLLGSTITGLYWSSVLLLIYSIYQALKIRKKRLPVGVIYSSIPLGTVFFTALFTGFSIGLFLSSLIFNLPGWSLFLGVSILAMIYFSLLVVVIPIFVSDAIKKIPFWICISATSGLMIYLFYVLKGTVNPKAIVLGLLIAFSTFTISWSKTKLLN